jgi:hypothetical protein
MALCHDERDYAMGFSRFNPHPPKPLAPAWRAARHLEPTSEGPYLVDCSKQDCKDPTHFGGTVEDSAKFLDQSK